MKKEDKEKKKRGSSVSGLTKNKVFANPSLFFTKKSEMHCTFATSYHTPITQQPYTVNEASGNLICEACANFCHSGNAQPAKDSSPIPFICSCGSKGSVHCKAWDNKQDRLDKCEFNLVLLEEVYLKWDRPLQKCSVGADLPRLGHKHELRNENGFVIFPEKKEINGHDHLTMSKSLISIMMHLLQPCNLDHDIGFDAHFANLIADPNAKIDFGCHANEFFKKLGDDHLLVKLLKASCSQGIVSPAWVKMKLELMDGIAFKDAKQGWQVYVLFSDNFVSVVHRKNEQGEPAEDAEPDAYPFFFTWELQMVFDRAMKHLLYTFFRITHLEIVLPLEPEVEAKLRAVARDWLEESAVPPVGCAIPEPDVVSVSTSSHKLTPPTGKETKHRLTGGSNKGGRVSARSPPKGRPIRKANEMSQTDQALMALKEKYAASNEADDGFPEWLRFEWNDEPDITLTNYGSVPQSERGEGLESMFLKKALPQHKPSLSPRRMGTDNIFGSVESESMTPPTICLIDLDSEPSPRGSAPVTTTATPTNTAIPTANTTNANSPANTSPEATPPPTPPMIASTPTTFPPTVIAISPSNTPPTPPPKLSSVSIAMVTGNTDALPRSKSDGAILNTTLPLNHTLTPNSTSGPQPTNNPSGSSTTTTTTTTTSSTPVPMHTTVKLHTTPRPPPKPAKLRSTSPGVITQDAK